MAEIRSEITNEADTYNEDQKIKSLYTPLQENIQTIKQGMHNTYTYFSIEVLDTSKMLTIYAEPCNEESDPDIYLSNTTPYVDMNNYIWESTKIGADKLQIHPYDAGFKVGTYYIGVHAYKQGLNTFKVWYTLTEIPISLELNQVYTGIVHDWKYFKFPIKHAGDSRIEVKLSPGYGKLALFVSKDLYYPSEKEHQWSLGFYGDISIFDDDFFGSTYDVLDLDPYDEYLKRNYTRRPTALELERIAKLEETEPRRTDGGELRFCIDSDDWKCTSEACFVSVRNLTNEDVEFNISQREVPEVELVPPELAHRYQYFTKLFEDVDGGNVSGAERKRLKITGKCEFTYGEIEFMHMVPIFELCKPKEGEVFYDLGCGAGKCLVAAALAFPNLRLCKGIELLPGLCDLCKRTVDSMYGEIQAAPIEVIQGDILEIDWSDADIIYTSSICFPQEIIEGMLVKASQLKKGSRIITLKLFPPNEVFETKFNVRVKMTWGKTAVYVLEKIV
ncbi:unnamed protein product [Blepharisma stoltei]|uniref:Histone-lysine N-methyltransferase, H3 lysine-79 specific n=1 Tax=Blepharisma stoltei TaxID=1481888 RepID=A0AAU9J9C2_9CILI|nr:unnamed protein product [Blepharisma stoltei]